MTRKADPYPLHDLDWGRPESLVRFALLARTDNVCDALGWTRSRIAERLRITAAGLHEKLSLTGLVRGTAPEFVRDMQRLLQVTEAQLPRTGGELFSFYESVMNRWTDTETLRVPSTFFGPLLATGDSSNEEEALARSAALAGIRRQAFNLDEAARLRSGYIGATGEDLMADTMHELLTVIGLPHPQHMLAVGLAAELEDWVLPVIDDHLRHSPIGWRSPQVLTRMLRLYEDRTEVDRTQYLFLQVQDLLKSIVVDDLACPDPGRVFVEEALRRTPGRRKITKDRQFKGPYETWSWSWVPAYLKSVALDPARPLRQRTYAAVGLLRRDETFADARTIAEVFEVQAADDPTEGLAYAAQVLTIMLNDRQGWDVAKLRGTRRHMLDIGVRAFAETDAYRRVSRHFDLEDLAKLPDGPLQRLPQGVRLAAQALILEAILSIDATRRRTACDALIAAGAANETALTLTGLLHDSDTPVFVQETIAVVLGYLGDYHAIPALSHLANPSHPGGLQLPAVIALGEIHSADAQKVVAAQRTQALITAIAANKQPTIRHAAVLSLATLTEATTASQRATELDRIATTRAPVATRTLATWGHRRLTSPTLVKAGTVRSSV